MAWSDSSLRRTGWAVWGAQATVLVLALVVEGSTNTDGVLTVLSDLFFLFMVFSFPTIGVVVLRRQPRHRLAWFMILGIGTALVLPMLLEAYAQQGLAHQPTPLPGAAVAASLNQGNWVWSIGTIAIFLVLLFPDGRLPSRRWRWLAWVGAIDIVLVAASIALIPGRLEEGSTAGVHNPIGLEQHKTLVLVVFGASLALLPLCILSAAVAMVVRFRRSQGAERLQLKWFAAAAAFVAVAYLMSMVAQLFKPTPFAGTDPEWLTVLQNLTTLSFVALPIAIGISILRHRLYDIDVVIKRSLVYGTLTVSLLAVYLVVVLALRSLTNTVTGDSQLAVATSTLVVAALFRPFRRRIQRGVDRRFYRRTYDAALTVDSFAERLRQEVDLDALTADLRDVVTETMQPTQLTVWLRDPQGHP